MDGIAFLRTLVASTHARVQPRLPVEPRMRMRTLVWMVAGGALAGVCGVKAGDWNDIRCGHDLSAVRETTEFPAW
jgi:hypothetical protein